jgi:hypothetical protein
MSNDLRTGMVCGPGSGQWIHPTGLDNVIYLGVAQECLESETNLGVDSGSTTLVWTLLITWEWPRSVWTLCKLTMEWIQWIHHTGLDSVN